MTRSTPLPASVQPSPPRFLHTHLPPSGIVELDELEARHASNVLRLCAGSPLILFDGVGGEALGRVSSVTKRQVQVEIIERSDTNRELSQPLQMLVALPKGDRQKTLVDGLVQLGVWQLIPLVCERGVAQPTGKALERLRRTVVESCKQCGRNQLMAIAEPQQLQQLGPVSELPQQLSLFGHPYHNRLELANVDRAAIDSARVAIGPEGGFSDPEVATFQSLGWQNVGLGPRILRIELAAIQVAAWWANSSSYLT